MRSLTCTCTSPFYRLSNEMLDVVGNMFIQENNRAYLRALIGEPIFGRGRNTRPMCIFIYIYVY